MSPSATHVALVGLSGTGKSTVAPLLAAHRGVAVVDLDRLIEGESGLRVHELFARDGEPAFRRLESGLLRRALEGPPAVVATGGGVVLDPLNRELLGQRARVVWLRADPAELASRLAGTAEARPLLAGDPESSLRSQAAQREALYDEVADLVVDVADRTPREIAEEIAAVLDREQP